MTASGSGGTAIGAVIEGVVQKVRRLFDSGTPFPTWAHEEEGVLVVNFEGACAFLELHTDPITAVAKILDFLKKEYPETSNYRIE